MRHNKTEKHIEGEREKRKKEKKVVWFFAIYGHEYVKLVGTSQPAQIEH